MEFKNLRLNYSITYLDRINIFYPELTPNAYCPAYNLLFLVQKINETTDSIQTLDGDNMSCFFIEVNITSSTFLLTWSIVNKFSSIVKLNGFLDSTRINTIDSYYSFDLVSLGKNYYRIRYYENFYIPRLSNSNWEISFNNSGQYFSTI
ncbi:hypothetical protein ACTFIT_012034 [Dictyostelium discoideum]